MLCFENKGRMNKQVKKKSTFGSIVFLLHGTSDITFSFVIVINCLWLFMLQVVFSLMHFKMLLVLSKL